jgi:vitamin B12 transporter
LFETVPDTVPIFFGLSKRLILMGSFVVFLSQSILLYAQKEQSLCEVTVRGIKPERFMVGLKVQEIDSATLALFRFSTATDFLQFQAPVSFKTYGAGQASSIAFRGTSASHTAVLWNGVNINFPSLGQTDFSTLPMTGFDQMSIQYGSAASCVGTDAVGGSIILRSSPNLKTNGGQFLLANRIESNQNYSSQVGYRFNQKIAQNWVLSSKTLLYGNRNNYHFKQVEVKTRKGEVYGFEPVQNSQSGLIQDLFLTKNNGNQLALNLWITANDVLIQPKKASFQEILNTDAFRLIGAYLAGKTLFRAGFIRDVTDYGKGEDPILSNSKIDRFIGRIEHDFSWIKSCDKGTNLKIGAEIVHFKALVDGYGKTEKNENRMDFYALLRHQFNAKLSSSLNLRQAFVTGYNPPFTPSIGIDYQALKQKNTIISFPANIALSYRVPTLNERYWLQLGNPDIKPEKGFNKEAGLVWKQRFEQNLQSTLSVNVFHNLIDNWAYWNPERNYRVENLQQVLSKGFEIDLRINKKGNKMALESNLGYGLTDASQQKEFGAYTQDVVGKQLIYVPKHTVSSSSRLIFKQTSFSFQQQFQSRRFVTFDHSGRSFEPFYLANALVNQQFNFNQNTFDVALQINNLTNSIYPNLKKNAMPLRTIALNVVWGFARKN